MSPIKRSLSYHILGLSSWKWSNKTRTFENYFWSHTIRHSPVAPLLWWLQTTERTLRLFNWRQTRLWPDHVRHRVNSRHVIEPSLSPTWLIPVTAKVCPAPRAMSVTLNTPGTLRNSIWSTRSCLPNCARSLRPTVHTLPPNVKNCSIPDM